MKREPRKLPKKRAKKRAKKSTALAVVTQEIKKELQPTVNKLKISMTMLSRAKQKKLGLADLNPFIAANHPPGVFPKGYATPMAQDDAIMSSLNWAGSLVSAAWEEGLQFLGYPYLSALAQRAEYRNIVETIATEMTRKWIKIQSKGKKDQSEKIQKLEDAIKRYKLKKVFQQAAAHDMFFGRGHIFVDLGDNDNKEELEMSIGDGRDELSKAKIGKGSLRRFKNVEPIWAYPTQYNSTDPTRVDWYKPDKWYVMSKSIHASRFLTFIGRDVPDILKPAYSFGGLSLTQMAKPYVDNWLRTRQSVSDLIHSFSIVCLKTNLSTMLQVGGDDLFNRADFFNATRDNKGLQIVDKDTEDMAIISTPLGTLDHLQAQSQEQMCSVSRIPLVKFTGISPTGLNASSEGEIRVFYDTINASQEDLFGENLTRCIDFIQLSEFGEVDPDLVYIFEPLWSLDEKTMSDVQKVKADTAAVHINSGVLAAEEVRTTLAADANSGYNDINPEDVPEPEEPEMGGEGEENEDMITTKKPNITKEDNSSNPGKSFSEKAK